MFIFIIIILAVAVRESRMSRLYHPQHPNFPRLWGGAKKRGKKAKGHEEVQFAFPLNWLENYDLNLYVDVFHLEAGSQSDSMLKCFTDYTIASSIQNMP